MVDRCTGTHPTIEGLRCVLGGSHTEHECPDPDKPGEYIEWPNEPEYPIHACAWPGDRSQYFVEFLDLFLADVLSCAIYDAFLSSRPRKMSGGHDDHDLPSDCDAGARAVLVRRSAPHGGTAPAWHPTSAATNAGYQVAGLSLTPSRLAIVRPLEADARHGPRPAIRHAPRLSPSGSSVSSDPLPRRAAHSTFAEKGLVMVEHAAPRIRRLLVSHASSPPVPIVSTNVETPTDPVSTWSGRTNRVLDR